MSNHDPHYRIMSIEPFDVMEQRMYPTGQEFGEFPSPKQCLSLAIAMKHIMRAGLKDGQPWEKDIQKAMNYLHRALTGKWMEQ